MTVLLLVGVGVVALGALVLLLFPDRPGGKIAWQGAEVSSIGAGLPLIVVGIVAIGMSGGGVIGGGGGSGVDGGGNFGKKQTTAVLKCPDDLGARLPPQRVATVESGAHDCHPVEAVSLVPGEGRLAAVSNYNGVRIDFSGRSYVVDIGGGSDIRLDFYRFVP